MGRGRGIGLARTRPTGQQDKILAQTPPLTLFPAQLTDPAQAPPLQWPPPPPPFHVILTFAQAAAQAPLLQLNITILIYIVHVHILFSPLYDQLTIE